MLTTLLKKLYKLFSDRDTKTVDIYFEFLNVWWLFILWNPTASIAFDITSPLYSYLLGIWTGALLFVAAVALLSNKLYLRLGVLLAYVLFYFLTGINLLLKGSLNPLGGFFICQGILAALLLWKIRSRQSVHRE